MLKPSVVYALLWIYKGGLIGLLIGTVLLRLLRYGPFSTRPAKRAAQIALLGFYGIVAVAGTVVGFSFVTLATGILCLSLYGLLRCVHRKKPLTWLLLLPLCLGGPFGWRISESALDDSDNPLVPIFEQRLNRTLVCRAYPHDFDSLSGTRLVVARESGNWFTDEILDELLVKNRPSHITCTETSEGHVILKMRAPGSGEEVEKRVVVRSPANR